MEFSAQDTSGSAASEFLHRPGDISGSASGSPREEVLEASSAPPEVAHQAPRTGSGLPVLAPHRAWQPHHVPDIHSALPWVLVEGIVDIVTGEGPVVTDRVYELYVRASGGHRVTKPVRDALDQATRTAIEKGLLEEVRDNINNRLAETLYLPGTPSVVLRRRGDRELEDIPPTEVAAVARHILDHDSGVNDTELKRLLLKIFERVRLTNSASAFLDGCIRLSRN